MNPGPKPPPAFPGLPAWGAEWRETWSLSYVMSGPMCFMCDAQGQWISQFQGKGSWDLMVQTEVLPRLSLPDPSQQELPGPICFSRVAPEISHL